MYTRRSFLKGSDSAIAALTLPCATCAYVQWGVKLICVVSIWFLHSLPI
ncbi:twin-arginine translocation signal domain-containing protein [Phormidesmis priestleyi]